MNYKPGNRQPQRGGNGQLNATPRKSSFEIVRYRTN